MNEAQFKGKWEQLKGQIQKQWGKLTNDDIQAVNGERKVLLGKIIEREGITRDEAEKQLDRFVNEKSL